MENDLEIRESFDRRKNLILEELSSMVRGGNNPTQLIDSAAELIRRFTKNALPEWKKRIERAEGYTIPIMVRYDGMLSYYEEETMKLKLLWGRL